MVVKLLKFLKTNKMKMMKRLRLEKLPEMLVWNSKRERKHLN